MINADLELPATSEKTDRLLAAGTLATAGAASLLLWNFDPARVNFFPACPLFQLTGFACPGCGTTRGFHALLHGDLLTAIDYNLLVPLFAAIGFVTILSLVSVVVRGKGLIRLSKSPVYLFTLFGVMVIFGILRNIPYEPFTFLFP